MIIKMLGQDEAAGETPKVLFLPDAWNKIRLFTDMAPGEVSGVGSVERRGGKFLVTDAFLIRPSGFSSGYVEFDARAFNAFVREFIKNRKSPNSLIKLQWHSHGNIGVSFSETDKDTIRGYPAGGIDFMISLVVNKKHQHRCRIDIFQPVYVGLDVSVYLVLPRPSSELEEFCRKEVAKKMGIFDKINCVFGKKHIGEPEDWIVPLISGEEKNV